MVIAHEAFGVDAEMRRHADRLAGLGYLTVIPDLYSEGGMVRCVVGVMRSMSAGHGRAFTDIEADRRWLLEQPDCTGRVGVVGFCMGGGFAIASAPSCDASAPNYGMLPKNLKAAVENSCPVVASYGAKDVGLRSAAARLRGALEEKGVPHDVKEYPGAGHSFMNDAYNGLRAMGDGPHPESAADAWRCIDAFFTEHLGTPPQS